MNQLEWCKRRLPVGILNAVLVFSYTSIGVCQNPMPAAGDKHFCEWWHAKIGPASDPTAPQPSPSKKSASENAGVQPVLDELDLGTAASVDPDRVAELDEATVLAAIACLLQLEEDTRPANFMGVTWWGVSQIFDWAPMNLAALYYASYLFTCNWKHGNAIALRGPGAEELESKYKYRTTTRAIHRAYGSYRHWYQELKAMGLARAREEKLDPLAGTGLYWY